LSSGTVVVAHKSVGRVRTKPSFQAQAVYSLYCSVFMTQLKFYNCHMKRSEIAGHFFGVMNSVGTRLGFIGFVRGGYKH